MYKLDINVINASGNSYLHTICIEIGKIDLNLHPKVLLNICTLLTFEKVKVDTHNKDGNTCLHYFCQRCSSKNIQNVISLMKQRGININAHNKSGETPLHKACINLNPITSDIVKILIEEGSSVNASTNSGDTPLHYALNMKRTDVIQTLIDLHGDVNFKNKHGLSPKEIASTMDEKIKVLFQNSQRTKNFFFVKKKTCFFF